MDPVGLGIPKPRGWAPLDLTLILRVSRSKLSPVTALTEALFYIFIDIYLYNIYIFIFIYKLSLI